MRIFFVTGTALVLLFALSIETKDLVCTKPEKTDSTIITYQIVPGKKGARGLKGCKGESVVIAEQELDKLNSNNSFLITLLHNDFVFFSNV